MFNFKKTYVLPFRFKVQNNTHIYLKQNSIFSRYIKYIKRYFFIYLTHQNSLEIYNIEPAHKSILWINTSAPSYGDSLMDLSSRVLLRGKMIDLFTDIASSKLYADDSVISNVFTNKTLIEQNQYDLVIIDSYSTRSIRIKNDIAPLVPFIGMFGFFNGPDVNRTLFSFHRMNQLLGYIRNESYINAIAKPSLSISTKDQEKIQLENLPENYIIIALGGEWSFRTFNNWDILIERIFKEDKNINIVLVGSSNGASKAKSIMDQFADFNIFNFVSKITFNQTAQVIKHGKILICCDGGLMHAASAVNITLVPLFARVDQKMRLTESNCSFHLFDKKDVNRITVDKIYNMYLRAYQSIDIFKISKS